jgi:hypothetical protein
MKGNILQGTARGRMGEIVAKVVHGKQIYQKYQPNISNPKSPKQTQTREIFTQISKSIKNMREFLAKYGINFYYTTYAGASKNIRNIIYPYSFKHAKILNDELNNAVLKVDEPLLIESITGNQLNFFIEDNGFVGAFIAQSDAGIKYFGSDKPIAGKQLFSAFVSSSIELQIGKFTEQIMDLTLISVDRLPSIGQPKQFGLFDSVKECGEWNYIYSGNFGGDILAECELIGFNTTKKQFSAYGVIFDEDSQIILAGGINSFKLNP